VQISSISFSVALDFIATIISLLPADFISPEMQKARSSERALRMIPWLMCLYHSSPAREGRVKYQKPYQLRVKEDTFSAWSPERQSRKELVAGLALVDI